MPSSPYLLVFQKRHTIQLYERRLSVPRQALFSILLLVVTKPVESLTSTVEQTPKVSSAFPHDSQAASLLVLLLLYQPDFLLL